MWFSLVSGQMIMNEFLKQIVCCPRCRGDLREDAAALVCESCHSSYAVVDGIPLFVSQDALDTSCGISLEKWDQHYTGFDAQRTIDEYRLQYESDVNMLFDHAMSGMRISSRTVLEIGCGPAPSRPYWSSRGFAYAGMDFSLSVLKKVQALPPTGSAGNNFVCGDILHPPFKENAFDLIWGSGVIEHFKDTAGALAVMRRILRPGGRIIATFPCLSLGALTYRQVWGNIPDVLFVREIAEFVHITLLRKRLMRFGYEYSFSERRIRDLVKKASLELIDFGHFDIITTFEYVSNDWLRTIFRKMEKWRPFWAMAYMIAEK
jgi:SAM-dependent methyltransferase